MDIVLLEDVKALGKKGQIVKVNDGYARNFILPKKLGVEATSKNLNDLKLQKANDARLAAEQLAAARELAKKVEASPVTVSIKAGEGGRTFGSVSTKEIGKAVTLDLGDGYEATYGQLTEITVKENSYVNPGDAIGSVAAPTKYYSTEGSNVYFALTHNGEPVNGEALFR